MNDNNLFTGLLNDKFLREYIIYGDSESASSVSLISGCMMSLDSEEAEEWTACERHDVAQEVNRQLCHILQSRELLGIILDTAFDGQIPVEAIDMNEFFRIFTGCVRGTLNEKCDVKLKSHDKMVIRSNRRFLRFILLLYIRSAVLDGCTSLSISYSATETDFIIEVKINKKSEELKNQYPDDDLYANYQKEMNEIFVKKIGGEIRTLKSRIKITLHNCILPENTESSLKEIPDFYKNALNAYNIMLSDVGGHLMKKL